MDVVGNGIQRDLVFLGNAFHRAVLVAIDQGQDEFIHHRDLGKAGLALMLLTVSLMQSLEHPVKFQL